MLAILNSTGVPVAWYTHDAWGNDISYDYGIPMSTIGQLNPLRYRGYVYDTETELYYLQSRYYNPEWGRFINADSYVATGQGLLGNNMFAYCINSPTNYLDKGGDFLGTLIGAVVGAACGAVDALIQGKTGSDFTASVLSGATSGAISGAVADVLLVTGGSAAVVVAATAGASAVGTIAGAMVESAVTNKPVDWKETLADAAFNTATGALFGYMGGPVKSSVKVKGLVKAAKSILKKEVKNIGSSIAEEALGKVTEGMMKFTKDVFVRRIKDTFSLSIK